MDLILLLRFIMPFFIVFILLFIMKENLANQKSQFEKEILFYLILSLILFILSMGVYALTPFLSENQTLVAEFTLGKIGSLPALPVGRTPAPPSLA